MAFVAARLTLATTAFVCQLIILVTWLVTLLMFARGRSEFATLGVRAATVAMIVGFIAVKKTFAPTMDAAAPAAESAALPRSPCARYATVSTTPHAAPIHPGTNPHAARTVYDTGLSVMNFPISLHHS